MLLCALSAFYFFLQVKTIPTAPEPRYVVRIWSRRWLQAPFPGSLFALLPAWEQGCKITFKAFDHFKLIFCFTGHFPFLATLIGSLTNLRNFMLLHKCLQQKIQLGHAHCKTIKYHIIKFNQANLRAILVRHTVAILLPEIHMSVRLEKRGTILKWP